MQLKTTKKCNKCKITKKIAEFNFRNKEKGYLQSKCKKCSSDINKKYRESDKEKHNKRLRDYRFKNKDKVNNWERNYRKQRYKESLEIRKKVLAKRNKYRAKKGLATLKGFDKELKKIYLNCPKGYHVDHIMPLNHSNLCGLHVPWNLQYLPAEENLRKSNKI